MNLMKIICLFESDEILAMHWSKDSPLICIALELPFSFKGIGAYVLKYWDT